MNQKFQRTCLVVLLSFVCLFALAQGKQVSGIVKDTSGEPVIGANVIVKGTTNGTITAQSETLGDCVKILIFAS